MRQVNLFYGIEFLLASRNSDFVMELLFEFLQDVIHINIGDTFGPMPSQNRRIKFVNALVNSFDVHPPSEGNKWKIKISLYVLHVAAGE